MKSIRPSPSEIEYKNCRFLITDRPSDSNIQSFVGELQKRNVHELVRVCESTYEKQSLETHGIRVSDLAFDDGSPPPIEVVDRWLQLLRSAFESDPSACVAVHCVAGLGRAPVLVAVALIELGMRYEDAVIHIRQKRRGAINAKQLSYLEKYRPKARLKRRLNGTKCCVM